MEYIIYSDESISKGVYYSDFFGGALVAGKDWQEVNAALNRRKQELNLFGEIKWTKVSVNYLEKYKKMMDLFFSFVKENKVKIRIMFRDSEQIPYKQVRDPIANKYHLLYYQFIKHAFGLVYHNDNCDEVVYLRLFFDQIADTARQNIVFRSHILHLQRLRQFRKARIVIRPEDIVEIDSHRHAIQQCMDIILGAMSFRLNHKREDSSFGEIDIGKKTQAKYDLFNHIYALIKEVIGDEVFAIDQTTLPDRAEFRWSMPYRHWKFVTSEFRMKEI